MKLLWLWEKKMCQVFIEIDVWNCWVCTNTSLPSCNVWKKASFPLDFFMKLLTGVCIYRWAKIFRRAVCHPQSFADMPEILADWNKHLCSRPIQT